VPALFQVLKYHRKENKRGKNLGIYFCLGYIISVIYYLDTFSLTVDVGTVPLFSADSSTKGGILIFRFSVSRKLSSGNESIFGGLEKEFEYAQEYIPLRRANVDSNDCTSSKKFSKGKEKKRKISIPPLVELISR
jgi:hypothetical protein